MTFSVCLKQILKSYGANGLKRIFFRQGSLTTLDSLQPKTCTVLVGKIMFTDKMSVATLALGWCLAQIMNLGTEVIMCADILFQLLGLFCIEQGTVS